MKTLKNQTLLYDGGCPLCSVYTTGFIKAGMLDANGKKPYESLTDAEKQFVDTRRACNEIALIDNDNKTVTYGIDSLLKVVGHSFPLIENVGNLKPIHWLLKKLYSFISYNRKAIMPNTKPATGTACLPDFNYFYRIAYIVFAGLVAAVILHQYRNILFYVPQGSFTQEALLAFCQIPFQWLFIMKRNPTEQLNYFGSLLTVSLFGALLLLPLLCINHFFNVDETVNLLWFIITAMVIFLEHYRRVKLLQLPYFLCFTWMAYRLIALCLILEL